MVHVPFLGIDLPEPRLVTVLPNTVAALIQGTHKLLEYGGDFLKPASQIRAEEDAVNEAFGNSLPPEFDVVRKRVAEGKIIDDEQLSSEVEDAAYDWYRRQLRVSVLGETGDDMEDVATRKLGLDRPSMGAALQEAFIADRVAAEGGLDLAEELQEAAAVQQLREEEYRQQDVLAARVRHIAELRRQLQPTSRQVVNTVTNASVGALLGVLLAKTLAVGLRKVLRRGKGRPAAPAPQRRPGQDRQQQQQQQQQQAAIAAAAAAQQQMLRSRAAAAAAPARSASQQPAAAAQQKGASTAQAKTSSSGKAEEAPAAGRKTRAPAKKR